MNTVDLTTYLMARRLQTKGDYLREARQRKGKEPPT